jgi:formate-dependent nitrite reductase membrane component NrfD
MFSQYTTYLANHLCGGSSRQLIAGWWYSILGMTIAITLLSLTMINNSNNNSTNSNYSSSSTQQCIIALWSSFLLCCFSIGGTMIMRKFHNSIAVGFFMGVTVTSCQFYIALALLYFHYRHYNIRNTASGNAKDVTLFACLSIVQAILLGTFAIILAAHRTEITFDSNSESAGNNMTEHHPPQSPTESNNDNEELYQGPPQQSSRSSHLGRK